MSVAQQSHDSLFDIHCLLPYSFSYRWTEMENHWCRQQTATNWQTLDSAGQNSRFTCWLGVSASCSLLGSPSSRTPASLWCTPACTPQRKRGPGSCGRQWGCSDQHSSVGRLWFDDPAAQRLGETQVKGLAEVGGLGGGGYSLNCETLLQCSVLLSALEHHEEARFFAAAVEGWTEMEEDRNGRREAGISITLFHLGCWKTMSERDTIQIYAVKVNFSKMMKKSF